MSILVGVVVVVIVLVAAFALGLRMKPDKFPAYPAQTSLSQTISLPDDLPAPVVRYYQATIGDQIPVIDSVVLTGSARLRFNGITFNSRFRFTHEAGQNYRHYIEATIFGFPLLKVNESYLEGQGRMELPFGTIENEPQIDQGANLGLWGESMWLPPIFITDSRVRWEAIDDMTARLIVPFGAEEDSFTVTFDPETGLLHTMEAMRYQEADSAEKTLWTLEAVEWDTFHGMLIPSVGTATWADEGTPWSRFTIEDAAYNVDVSEYIRQKGM